MDREFKIGRDLVASHDAFYNFKIRNYLKDLTRVLNNKKLRFLTNNFPKYAIIIGIYLEIHICLFFISLFLTPFNLLH